MHAWMIVVCLLMAGCFRSIDSGSGPVFFDAGPGRDSGPRFRDSGPELDAPPTGFDSAVPDSAVPDAAVCPECEFDSDCPQPPPFGCGQGVCVAGVCAVGTGNCDEGEACDQGELVCTAESVELQITVRTDYEPFVEFDRVVIAVDDAVVHQDTELTGDPFAGLLLAPIFVGHRDELRLGATLYLDCAEVDSSLVTLTGVSGPTSSLTIVMAR